MPGLAYEKALVSARPNGYGLAGASYASRQGRHS